MNLNGLSKSSCQVGQTELANRVCPHHFTVNNIVSRKGKLFGYEVLSSWFDHKTQGYMLPQHSLHNSLAYLSMLTRLNHRLADKPPLSESNEKVFLPLDRPFLLDSNIVKQLISLGKRLHGYNKELVLVMDSLHTALVPYTVQAEYALIDNGIRHCLKTKIKLGLQDMHTVEYLMYDAQDIKQEAVLYPATTDLLFSLREKGFELILNGAASASDYNLGYNLPFNYFKA